MTFPRPCTYTHTRVYENESACLLQLDFYMLGGGSPDAPEISQVHSKNFILIEATTAHFIYFHFRCFIPKRHEAALLGIIQLIANSANREILAKVAKNNNLSPNDSRAYTALLTNRYSLWTHVSVEFVHYSSAV
jgi:hypothetical protein